MSSTQKDFDTLQKEAELLPGNLIQAMAERDGPEEGGLTLTREHIVTLNQYANHVFSLPVAQDALIRWLSYSTIAEPALMPNSMGDMHKQLQQHGRSWTTLADNSRKLGFELAASANGINTTGDEVLVLLEKSSALGKRREAWDTLRFDKPISLGTDDKRRVLDLVDCMEVLREDVDLFARRVSAVREEIEQFRDHAREKLLPLVATKTEAIKRQKASGAVQYLREDLADLSERLQKMEVLLREVVTASSHFHSAWQSLTVFIDASAERLRQITTGQQLARFAIYFGRFLGQWSTIEQIALEMNRKLTRFHS
ncbi:hypothetical protein GPJ81_06090 [Pseudomonas alkylphenolica]|uniref:Binary cytotoxin component n=1 Tax=Pseudomonas alkylphenolica TaxID=237609 RepID=A0A6I6H4W5_9PSED|nr:hypothetical protein [Pseudomonas alkylphenolica]QGW76264.1 hypothetical protein GPJ81_06090 [Pseudomonas alkylphenolica]